MGSDAAKKRVAAKKAAASAKHGGGCSTKGSAAAGVAGSTEEEETADPLDGGVAALARVLRVTLPATLTPRQRAAVHAAAEEVGLVHVSRGEGLERRLVLGKPPDDADVEEASAGSSPCEAATGSERPPAPWEVRFDASESLSEAALCESLLQLLGLDVEPHLAEGGPTARGPGGLPAPKSRGLIDLDSWVARMLPLVDMERDAEVAAAQATHAGMKPSTAQARGQTLLNLKCVEAEGGLLGKTILTLEPWRGEGAPLPPHKFGPHDVVALRPSKADSGGAALAEGVVYRVYETKLLVAVEETPEEGLEAAVRLEKLANDVTYTRLKATLQALGAGTVRGPAGALVDVMFGRRPPLSSAGTAAVPLHFFNLALDLSQQLAVSAALAAAEISLVHGPPGTGKTTTVIEIIRQCAARGLRVLACAASNVAVDNLVERLARADGKLPLVRLGHPARLLPAVLHASLDAQVQRADNSALANDIRKEMKDGQAKLLRLQRRDYDERRALRGELRRLAKEERQRQAAAVKEVLERAQVTCATLTGAMSHHLAHAVFDIAIIDEAAQALEPACWAALLKAPKAVLAGDHLQLPPTITSAQAAKEGLGVTLFERLHDMYGEAVASMLTVQYRMNAAICSWASREMYGGRLRSHPSVAGHTLATPRGAALSAEAPPVLLLIDTAGGYGMEETAEEEGGSKLNAGEARVVAAHLRRLINGGVPPEAIGVITPYSAQVGLLRAQRPAELAGVEIATVDGFQGREKEAIVISMVRSNARREVGFLADSRRMNVAVTRARRHCCIIADTETVSSDPFLARMIAHFQERGEYRSASEFVTDS